MTATLGPLVLALVGLAPPTEAPVLSKELQPPVRLEAGGKVIDTDVGHAAPFVGDFFGTGVNDLLVGQFGDGILWVYRNDGTKDAPKLAERIKFNGKVPTG